MKEALVYSFKQRKFLKKHDMKKLLRELIPESSTNQLARKAVRGRVTKTPLLCTISGGQDSIVTFFVLLHMITFPKPFLLGKNKKITTLEILHCNHFWQSKNIASSRSLFQLSSLFKLPYTLFLPEKQFFTENSTRSWRKRLFFRILYLHKSLVLMTGHTQSDLIETKLNHLFRGTSFKPVDYTVGKRKLSGYFFSCQILSSNTFQVGSHPSKQKTNKTVFSRKSHFSFVTNFSLVSVSKISVWKLDKTRNSPSTHFSRRKKHQKFFFKKFRKHQAIQSFCSEISKNGKQLFFQSLDVSQKKEKNSSCFIFYSSSIVLLPRTSKLLENQGRLSVSRIVKIYDFPVSIDRTNFSSRFSRNQIRQQFLPIITLLIQKEISSSFLHFFEIFKGDSEVIEKQTSLVYFLLTLVQSEIFEKQENRECQIISFQPICDQSTCKGETDNFFGSRKVIKENCQRTIKNVILQKMYRRSQERDLSFVQISKLQQDFLN